MEVTIKGLILKFSGLLNEESPVESIKQSIASALERSKNKSLLLDFSSVKRANSCGILAWYKIISTLEGSFIYINTPRWLVEQFNISDFLGSKSKVQSIQADFYCPKNDSHELITLTIDKDIPVLESYENFSINLKNSDGLDLEMDFDPNDYFYFISANPEKFKLATNEN